MRTISIIGLGLLLAITACKNKTGNEEQSTDKQSADQKTGKNSFAYLKQHFADPPNEYRPMPLWVWNDELSKSKVDSMLLYQEMAGMGGGFVHPRPGLITEYLSDEYFELFEYTVERGKEMGMEIWIYDENSYPSGFGGGHVPAEMPESYKQGGSLIPYNFTVAPDTVDKFFIVLKKDNENYVDVTGKVKPGDKGQYEAYRKGHYAKQPWHGGYSWVDILVEGVTEKFLEVTMTGYEKVAGDEFGKTVPGVFSDENHILPAEKWKKGNMVKWTPDLFGHFEQMWGYSLIDALPSLTGSYGDTIQVRYHYYQCLLDLYTKRWHEPFMDYCDKKNLKWTGHYWEHNWPWALYALDDMAFYSYHHMPGIDMLMNEYDEGLYGQFGNHKSPKELASVANQLGKERTMSETYGAGGWDVRFMDLKRILDWEYALGVNFLNPHLTFGTIAGARKQDHPLSFSYHEPWWHLHHYFADYAGRLSLALSSGEQVNKVLIIMPNTSFWVKSYDVSDKGFEQDALEAMRFFGEVEKLQIEADYGSEFLMEKYGSVEEGQLIIGERAYNKVVLMPTTMHLQESTAKLIEQYLAEGGKVISFVDAPQWIEGRQNRQMQELQDQYTEQWHRAKSLKDPEVMNMLEPQGFHMEIGGNNLLPHFFHMRRQLEDGQLIFLANTDLENMNRGKIICQGNSVRELNLATGHIGPYTAVKKDDGLHIGFGLEPGGSLLLFIGEDELVYNDDPYLKDEVVESGASTVTRAQPNTMRIDYADVKVAGKSYTGEYIPSLRNVIYQAHGFDADPWDRAVQYKRNILERDTFTTGSGFEATYYFTMDDGVNTAGLQAVIERPELYTVEVNGQKAEALPGQYWLDREFGVFDIAALAKAGKNSIKISCKPMSIHAELSGIYILGDFDVQPAAKGFRIVKATEKQMGPWQKQGMPFYSHAVDYTKSLELKPSIKYIVKLNEWNGVVAEVLVNGEHAGIIGWMPFECEITDQLNDGQNEITVRVYGSLKNLLGPHHAWKTEGYVSGKAWSGSWDQAPKNQPSGTEYDMIDYGLFGDFEIISYNN